MGDMLSNFQKVKTNKQNLTADSILAYEEAYMKLLKKYKDEIAGIEEMMEQVRRERETFYLQKMPEIKAAMEQDEVSPEIQQQWLSEIQENTEKSLRISESLIQHYVTEHLEEFTRKLKETAGRI